MINSVVYSSLKEMYLCIHSEKISWATHVVFSVDPHYKSINFEMASKIRYKMNSLKIRLMQ